MAKSYLKVRILKKPYPISTLINITNQCPKGCCYCDSWKHPAVNMPTERVLKLLKELDKAGVARITFHGGDPLMHPDIGRILKEANKYNFFITISVRETLIKKYIKDLKNVDLVFLSFDGNQKAHDAHKGLGSFADLIPVFQALKDNGIPFQTTTVVSRLNVDDIGFILENAKKYNFQTHFQPIQFTLNKNISQSALHDPEKNPLAPLMLPKEGYVTVGKKLLKFKDEGANIATSKKIIELVFLNWPNPALTYLSYKLDKSIKCWAGLLYNSIAVTGELYPCGYYNPAYFPDRAPNVFNAGVANAMKLNVRNSSCQTCMIPCFMELNAMFSLDFRTIFNWLPKVLFPKIKMTKL